MLMGSFRKASENKTINGPQWWVLLQQFQHRNFSTGLVVLYFSLSFPTMSQNNKFKYFGPPVHLKNKTQGQHKTDPVCSLETSLSNGCKDTWRLQGSHHTKHNQTVTADGEGWEKSLSASPDPLHLPRRLQFTVARDGARWSLGLTCCGLISRAGRRCWGWPGHCWVVKRRFLHLRTFSSLSFLLANPAQLQHWGPSTPTCPPQSDAPLDLGGAQGESYRDIFTCPGWAWLELSQPVLQGSSARSYRRVAPCDTNLNVSPQKSSLLLIRMTGLAVNRRCRGLIEGTPDTHILANSWRGSALRCKPSDSGNESMKSPRPETSQPHEEH